MSWSIRRLRAKILACGLALLLAPSASVNAIAEELQRVDVFVSGTEGYHSFRIPAVISTQDGTVLAFCEGRKNNRADHGDIDLVLRRSEDGGKTWGPLQLVYEEGGDAEITIGNPCPVVDQANGRIWLPFCRDNDDVLVTYSDDDGQTWADPREITADVKPAGWTWYATGPGIGIQLQSGEHAGRLVIPCDHREPFENSTAKFSHVFFSDDQGETWQVGESVSPHTDECQVVELANGDLQINMRNYWERDGKQAGKGGMRTVAQSQDGGETWTDFRFDPTLVEPVCQASLIRLEGKAENEDLLLFSNPASKTKRQELTVRLSKDGGRSWPASLLLQEGPAAYSCLVELPGGVIGCLYESGESNAYERIVFDRFAFSSLLLSAGVGQNEPERQTKVEIQGEAFLINGEPTYKGREWNGHKIEGLLMNSRMVQGIFDDLNPETRARWAYPDTGEYDAERNTREFLEAMPVWRDHGLLAFTINLQGGSPEGYSREQPWHNSAIAEDGSLRQDYLNRLERILDQADELGMVVILGIFYFGQDERLEDEAAVIRAVDNTVDWVFDHGYTNVLIEVNNECNVRYDHEILQPKRIHELIERVKQRDRDGRRLLVGTSYGGGKVPEENVVRTSDFLLLHGNGVKDPDRIAEMVQQTRKVPGYQPMPILFNEDDHFEFDQPKNNMVSAISEYASWGYFDPGKNNYRDGYQSVPVRWDLNTELKRSFFNKVREITGAKND